MEICINNRPSLIALVSYACENDCNDLLKELIKQYFATNVMYLLNQKENYLHMMTNLQKGVMA